VGEVGGGRVMDRIRQRSTQEEESGVRDERIELELASSCWTYVNGTTPIFVKCQECLTATIDFFLGQNHVFLYLLNFAKKNLFDFQQCSILQLSYSIYRIFPKHIVIRTHKV